VILLFNQCYRFASRIANVELMAFSLEASAKFFLGLGKFGTGKFKLDPQRAAPNRDDEIRDARIGCGGFMGAMPNLGFVIVQQEPVGKLALFFTLQFPGLVGCVMMGLMGRMNPGIDEAITLLVLSRHQSANVRVFLQ